jgi:hypothetical protein
MSPTLSWADVLFRLALGLRTTILVSVAATAAMIQANWLARLRGFAPGKCAFDPDSARYLFVIARLS